MDSEKKPKSVGPWGGQSGSHFDDGVNSTVKQLIIAHGAGIDSIQIEYDKNGTSVWSQKHGGSGGDKTEKVKLEYPDEYLISIQGCCGSLTIGGAFFIRSLTFKSNKRTYGPFGVELGTEFSLPVTAEKIVGFHGRSGWYLDAIGVYLKPIEHNQNIPRPLVRMQNYNLGTAVNEKYGYSIIEGSVAQNYDIVLAVKQKDDFRNMLPSKHTKQDSDHREFIELRTNDKEKDKEKEKDKKTSRDVLSTKVEVKYKDKKPSLGIVPKRVEGVVCYGPWGGTGGTQFDDGTSTGIRQINLSRNVAIVSIKVQYDCNGRAEWGSKHGGTGGFKSERIVFDYPYEILTHITGTYGSLMYMGPNIIKSLTFHTNKGRHGPYGEEQGPSFTSQIKEGKIVGFHGREGLFLDAIGVHVHEGKVVPQASNSNAIVPVGAGPIAQFENPTWSSKLIAAKQAPTEEVALGFVKEPSPSGPGPWGGDGGKAWDDGVFTGIKQIFVTRAEAICSIQIEYDRNGQSVWSIKHGGNQGTTTHRVKLECPHEVLICISGYFGSIGRDEGSKVIKSLTFYTSRGKYGPFGEEVGTYFTSTKTEGKVLGFHGRSSMYLDAIGVHMQHWLGNQKTSRHSLFRMFN